MLQSIDRDGGMAGYDLELVAQVADAVGIPVVAGGGAGSLQNFRDAFDAGASALAAGAFFVFHGRHRAVLLTYPTREQLMEVFSGDRTV